MKIILKIGLATDGDYSLRNHEEFRMNFDGCDYENVYVFEENTPLYPYEEYSYNKFDSWWRAIRLLEHMLCELHVLHTHHYVLDYLYHMFDDAIKALHERKMNHYGYVSGNYDGTYIEYMIVDS